jgi:hypothetical protein
MDAGDALPRGPASRAMASTTASISSDAEPPAADLAGRPRPEATGWRREAVFWAAHVLFWLAAFGGLRLVIDAFRPAVPVSIPFVAARIGCCFAATAALRWLSLQEGFLRRLGVSKIGLVAGGLITSAVVIALALGFVERAWGPDPAAGRGLGLMARLAIDVTLLGNWCAIYFGIHLVRERNSTEFRAIEAESLALKHELHRLQSQISPHFLFNALNTIVASRENPETIDTVTQALANYLRFLLRPAATLEPLARELDAIEQYLTVQSVRFGDGLATRIECDRDVRGVPVPPVMVQPLVENALKYGAESGPRPLRLEIAARREGDWLVVEVANTGRWAPPSARASTGTGLHSLERRLQLLGGPRATLTHAAADGWVRVRIRMPLPPRAEPSAGQPESRP